MKYRVVIVIDDFNSLEEAEKFAQELINMCPVIRSLDTTYPSNQVTLKVADLREELNES